MGRSADNNEEEDVDLSDVSLLLEKNLKNPGVFVWLLTFSAGISGLLFGCESRLQCLGLAVLMSMGNR